MLEQAAIRIVETSQVGEARRVAARYAELGQFGPTEQGKIAIIATELGNNLVRHARNGLMLIQLVHVDGQPTVELLSLDGGPGIRSIDQSMRDGFSTGGTAGNGLGAVKRLSSEFDLYSELETGTAVLSRVTNGRGPFSDSQFQMGAVCSALQGEPVCGDCWCCLQTSTGLRIMVADGLGHGPLAAEASNAAGRAFTTNPEGPPRQFIELAHRALSGTRGAAMSTAWITPDRRQLVYSGVGNISGSIHSPLKSQGLASMNGIVGVNLLRVQEFEYSIEENDLLVLHSDGLKTRWSLRDHPGLSMRHPAIVAGFLFKNYRRDNDDATVVVVRFSSTRN